MRLIQKPKTRRPTAKEELNLDNLALLGPQWWIIRVSRVSGHEVAETLALKMSQSFPTLDFKLAYPSVKIKRKLKNGTISVKPKPLFPGCLFLRCVMDRELHDFIREFEGVGGFLGTRVGNTKRQINKPKEVDEEDMEAIFKKAKEEQEKADQAFEDEQKKDEALDSKNLSFESLLDPTKPGGRGRKSAKKASLKSGSTVYVASGAFAGFSGTLKKLDKKTGLATVGFTLFGKETLADIDAKEVIAETDINKN